MKSSDLSGNTRMDLWMIRRILRGVLPFLLVSFIAQAQGQGLQLTVGSAGVGVGSTVDIPVTASALDGLTTLQFTASWDPAHLSFTEVNQFGLPGVQQTVNFGLSAVEEGRLTFSWDDTTFQGVPISEGLVVFQIRFDAIGEVDTTSEVGLDSSSTLIEASDRSFQPIPVSVNSGTVEIVGINTPPTISGLVDVTVIGGNRTAPIEFQIGDGQLPASQLILSVESSVPGVVPEDGIVFGGFEGLRTVTAQTVFRGTGSSTITVTVSDGELSASQSFVVTVVDLVFPEVVDLYQNQSNPLELNLPVTMEIGDEILVDQLGFDQIRGAILQAFQFGFNASASAVGKEATFTVRLYKNDGPESNGARPPSSLIWESAPITLQVLGEGNVVDLNLNGIEVPPSFTWSLEVQGLEGEDQILMPLFDPPDLGNNFSDFWERNQQGGWDRKSVQDVQVNFYALFRGYLQPITENAAPNVLDDSYFVEESGRLVADDLDAATPDSGDDGVLSNDSDADGDQLIAMLLEPPGHALSFSFFEDGAFEYEQNGDEILEDSFTYLVTDGFHVRMGKAFITVGPINDNPPVFVPEDFIAFGNTLLESASSEGVTLKVPEFSHESLSIAGLFAVDTDRFPGVEVVYELPEQGDEAIPFGIDSLSGEILALGPLDFETRNQYLFTVRATEYLVNRTAVVEGESTGLSTDIVVSVEVLDVDDEPPVTRIQGPLLVEEGGHAVLNPQTLSANDVDSDDETLVFMILTPPQFGVIHLKEDESRTPISSFNQLELLDGLVAYLHDGTPHFSDSFEIQSVDPKENRSPVATVPIEITEVNDPPVAVEDSAETDEETAIIIDVLANDSDEETPEGLAITGLVLEGTLGRVEIVDGKTIRYDPSGLLDYIPERFSEVDRFSYTMEDDLGLSSTATVTVLISGLNDPPVAVDDAVETEEDVSVTFSVLDNDLDVDDPNRIVGTIELHLEPTPEVLEIIEFTQGEHGSVEFNPETNEFTYTPQSDFNGEDRFEYVVSDGYPESQSVGEVKITVLPVNDPPVAVDDLFQTDEDTALVLDLLSNDSDLESPEGMVIVHFNVEGLLGNIEPGSEENSWVYVPTGALDHLNQGDEFLEVFSYIIEDPEGLQSTATVSVTVMGLNDPPKANDDEASTDEDQFVSINVLANDVDVDSESDQTLSIVEHSMPANGQLTFDSETGLFSYAPDPDYNGSDTFTYTLTDGFEGSESIGSVYIVVNPINDAPVAEDDFYSSVPRNIGAVLEVLKNDFDVDEGHLLSIIEVGESEEGATVSILPNAGDGRGVLVDYVPPFGFTGEDFFNYTIEDPEGLKATATVFVTVTGENTPPVARGLADQHMDADQVLPPIPFILEDDATPPDEIQVDFRTSNDSLLPLSGIVPGGQGIQRTLTLSPTPGISGIATVTVILQDTELNNNLSEYSFNLIVFPVLASAGTAIDGYVAGGVVFFDGNLNGIQDQGEPSTITDGKGDFDLEIRVGDFDKNTNLALDPEEGVLVIQGGTDIATGLPLKTSLKAPAGSAVISPLTSLVVELQKITPGLSAQEAASSVSSAFNLEVDLLNYDVFTAARENDPAAAGVLKEMLKVQDTAIMLGGFLEGTGATSTRSAADQFYRNLAARVAAGAVVDLSDSTVISQVVVQMASNNNVDLGGGTSSLPDVLGPLTMVIQSSNVKKDQAATSGLNPVEIAAELTRVSIVSQGDTADDLIGLGEDYAVQDQVVQSHTGAALDDRVAAAQVGDITGDGGKPGAFQFLTNQFTVVENGIGLQPVTIVRQSGNRGQAVLLIELQSISATLGADFVNTPIRVVFNDFEVRKVISLQSNLIDDDVAEPNESLLLVLSTAPDSPLTEVIGVIRRAEVTVVDNDLPPVAADDSFSVQEDETLVLSIESLLSNDTDPDPGQSPTFQAFDSQTQQGGSVHLISQGTQLSYQPPADFHGVDVFSYTIRDDTGRTDSALVVVQVLPVNDPPRIGPVSDQSARVNQSLSFEVLLSDVDDPVEALNLEVLPSGPLVQSIQVEGEGASRIVTIVPGTDQSGSIQLELRVLDPAGDQSSKTIGLVITGRVIGLSSGFQIPGGLVETVLSLVSEGNENRVHAVLNYPQESLQFRSASLVTGEEANLEVDDSRIGSGVVALSISLPNAQTFSAGTQSLVSLFFEVNDPPNQRLLPIEVARGAAQTRIVGPEGGDLPFGVDHGLVTVFLGREGDLASRPDGDGRISLVDWIQSGRFLADLDTLNVEAGEFARADVAPLSEKGNGVFELEDWVQTGRFVAGLDEAGAVGGPLKPSPILLLAGVGGRASNRQGITLLAGLPVEVTLGSLQADAGSRIHVPLNIKSYLEVNAVSFTLEFDPSLIEFLALRSLDASVKPTILKNTSRLNQGLLPVAMALNPGESWPLGEGQGLEIEFRALKPGVSPMRFIQSPTAAKAVSPAALTLPSLFTDGNLEVLEGRYGPSDRVSLTIAGWLDDQSPLLELSGPSGLYLLEWSTDLVNWKTLKEVSLIGDKVLVEDRREKAGFGAFYRIKSSNDSLRSE